MKTFLFKTATTMKEHDCKKWWIDSNIVSEFKIDAKNLKEALLYYRNFVLKTAYIEISDNALKTKNAMFIDKEDGPKQVGYVITGKTSMQNDSYNTVNKYVDLWVEVLTIIDTEF